MRQGPASKILILSLLFILIVSVVIFISLYSNVKKGEIKTALNFLNSAERYGKILGYSERTEPLMSQLRQRAITSKKGKDLMDVYKTAYSHLVSITVLRSLQVGFILLTLFLLVGAVKWVRSVLPYVSLSLRAFVIRKRKRLSSHPIDRAISYLMVLLEKTDVPASIGHHRPGEGGLREHTYSVMEKALYIYRQKHSDGNIPVSSALFPGVPFEHILILLALAHDIGKIKTYVRTNGRYTSLMIPLLSQTSILFASILKKAGLDHKRIELLCKTLDPDQEILPLELSRLRSILREADQETVSRELGEVPSTVVGDQRVSTTISPEPVATTDELADDPEIRKAVVNAFFSVLQSLNINGIYGTNYDGWYNPDQGILALNVWKLATKLTLYLREHYPDKPIGKYQPTPGSQSLHPVVPLLSRVLDREGILITQYNGIQADRYLFNIRAGTVKFKAIYLIRPEKVPPDLLNLWTSQSALTIFPLKVLGRKNKGEIMNDGNDGSDE